MAGLGKLVCTLFILALGACASGPPSFEQNIRSAYSGGSVYVLYPQDGVVVLAGFVNDAYDKNAVLRVARMDEQNRKIVDRITVRERRRR